MLHDFYVYAYLDPRKPGSYDYSELHFDFEPFYIGKGREDRDKAHLRELAQPSAKYNKIKRTKIIHIIGEAMLPIIVHIQENLTEQEAWDMEEAIIQKIGRICENTGPLANFHKGGNGGVQPPEIRKKAVATRIARGHNIGPNKGKAMSPEQKEKIRQAHLGKSLSEEHKKHILEARAGYTHSEETKQKMREAVDPVARRNTTKDSWNDPEVRARRLEGLRQSKIKRKGIKSIWINNGSTSGRYDENKALQLLGQGWIRGRLPIKTRSTLP
jgi:hypothetical protein